MKIICIGRNYAQHAKELGNEIPDEPVVFLKPETALIPRGHPFYYPAHSQDVHFEVELVVRIDKVGKHIEERFAPRYYSSIGLGLDFTARDIQQECKAKGLPWEKAKAWDHSAPLSEAFIPLSEIHDINDVSFSLTQNGALVQKGNSKDMLFSIDRLIQEVSKYFTLKIGDLIYTGTPAGVGPISVGDELIGKIGEREMFRLTVK
ncbi:MAG: fumarylacetoacetate hydrolase family protein [Bacteroidetes bacterium]|jgi:acylpyruvate hydrolase|nr:fumarylacetoacetate hydrolase family protein [Bacteroidota bacterium]